MQTNKIIKVPNMSNTRNYISPFGQTIYNYYDY